ncbi:putative hscarg dehydrogenase [Rhizodiscina lignyota]|uniref:Hscarg dehydrogenase n=1 Tax=Rhizodiscina lignyota TaxID=1504668 RepID=A0A9P4IB43_9PEZI|nr:putative hscarg dehydrogenase [Rhizodiscina lignyota]
MSKLIVVVGITGSQGGSVARTFLDLPGWRVRGITRNPSSAAAQDFAAKGAEIVKGELDDKASLVAAFTGANAIFAVTDFWAHFGNADNAAKAEAAGKTINEYAYDLEVVQGINMAEAAASPEVFKTLERFVFSSLAEVRKWTGGKYKWVWHFDSKAEIVNYIKEKLPELDARSSFVQIGHYMTNWKLFPAMAPQKQPDGSFLVQKPEAPECLIPWVATERDTGAFVKALVEMPAGKQIIGVSEYMTWPEWTKLWGRVLGVEAKFVQLPMDQFLSDVPEVLKRELYESFAFNAEFGWTGGDPDVLKPTDLPVKIPLTSVEDYIRSEDWSSIM